MEIKAGICSYCDENDEHLYSRAQYGEADTWICEYCWVAIMNGKNEKAIAYSRYMREAGIPKTGPGAFSEQRRD